MWEKRWILVTESERWGSIPSNNMCRANEHLHWLNLSKRSACTALGPWSKNVVSTINVFLLLFSLSSLVSFLPEVVVVKLTAKSKTGSWLYFPSVTTTTTIISHRRGCPRLKKICVWSYKGKIKVIKNLGGFFFFLYWKVSKIIWNGEKFDNKNLFHFNPPPPHPTTK